jgi:hypothetical protein
MERGECETFNSHRIRIDYRLLRREWKRWFTRHPGWRGFPFFINAPCPSADSKAND